MDKKYWTELKDKTLVEENIIKYPSNFYGFVNHKDQLATVPSRTKDTLLSNKNIIKFDAATVVLMRDRYFKMYPAQNKNKLTFTIELIFDDQVGLENQQEIAQNIKEALVFKIMEGYLAPEHTFTKEIIIKGDVDQILVAERI